MAHTYSGGCEHVHTHSDAAPIDNASADIATPCAS